MYFTDRGIEELDRRRGDEEVTLAWVAEQLQVFTDTHPDFETAVERSRPGWRGSTTPTTSSTRERRTPQPNGSGSAPKDTARARAAVRVRRWCWRHSTS